MWKIFGEKTGGIWKKYSDSQFVSYIWLRASAEWVLLEAAKEKTRRKNSTLGRRCPARLDCCTVNVSRGRTGSPSIGLVWIDDRRGQKIGHWDVAHKVSIKLFPIEIESQIQIFMFVYQIYKIDKRSPLLLFLSFSARECFAPKSVSQSRWCWICNWYITVFLLPFDAFVNLQKMSILKWCMTF